MNAKSEKTNPVISFLTSDRGSHDVRAWTSEFLWLPKIRVQHSEAPELVAPITELGYNSTPH